MCRNNGCIFPRKQHGDPRQLSFGRAPIPGQTCPHTRAPHWGCLSSTLTARKGKAVKQACPSAPRGSTASLYPKPLTPAAWLPSLERAHPLSPRERAASASGERLDAGLETTQHLSLSLPDRNPEEETLLVGPK